MDYPALDPSVTTHTVSAGGHEQAVLEAGRGGRPLLLVHGFGGSKEDFADHLHVLAGEGWWAVSVDLLGHGSSSRPDDEDAYSLEVFAAQAAALVDALGWDRYVLLGHSMGGWVSQLLALEHADRLDGLILMNTGPGRAPGMDRDILELGAQIARQDGMAVLKEVMDAFGGGPLGSGAYERVCAERPGHREFSDRKLLSCAPAMYAKMIVAVDDQADRHDRLAELHVPALVLVGTEDQTFFEPAHELAEVLPDAELRVIDDAGHSPQFENPDAWRDAVLDYLSRR